MQQITFLVWLKMLFHASHPLTGTDGMYDLYWLQGTWINASRQDTLTEQWNVANDSSMVGFGSLTRGKEVVFSETLEIRLTDTGIVYLPVNAQKKEEKLVPFKLTRARRNTWTFENPAHDFPQRIVYHRKGKKHLKAFIDGKENGKYKKEIFKFMYVPGPEY